MSCNQPTVPTNKLETENIACFFPFPKPGTSDKWTVMTPTNFKMEKIISEPRKPQIIVQGDKEALERHQASIANTTEAVSTQKESIEEKKFSKGEKEEEGSVWGAKAEELLAEADECTRKIAKHLKSMIAAAQDAEALEAHTKAMQYEKMLIE